MLAFFNLKLTSKPQKVSLQNSSFPRQPKSKINDPLNKISFLISKSRILNNNNKSIIWNLTQEWRRKNLVP